MQLSWQLSSYDSNHNIPVYCIYAIHNCRSKSKRLETNKLSTIYNNTHQ